MATPDHIDALRNELNEHANLTPAVVAGKAITAGHDREGVYARCTSGVSIDSDDLLSMYHLEGPWPDGVSDGNDEDVTAIVHKLPDGVVSLDPNRDSIEFWVSTKSPETLRPKLIHGGEGAYVGVPEDVIDSAY